MSRLGSQPTEVIDRSAKLRFRWNGKRFDGFEGDTIASALAASGEHVFSRSMKYHRPRGILTADYWDPNLMVQVGDDPNVRAGHRLLEAGMDVQAQNVWPSLHRDIKAANGLVGRFLTAGFSYQTFMRPAWLWPTYERVLATFAPGGKVDPDTPHRYHDKRYLHPDVVVAGAGPAGIEAALAAAAAGAGVLLVEHEHTVGGHLRYSSSDSARTALAELRAALDASDVEVLTDSTVTGRYEDNWLGIVQRNHPIAVERLIKARAKVLVAAPGLIERPYVFEGNDRPGVVTSGAVRRLINLWGVKPGERAVVFTANSDGDDAAADLDRVGVEIAAVIDGRDQKRVSSAQGSSKAVEAVVAGGNRIEADLLVMAAGWTAPTSLLNMAGDRPVYDPAAARFFPSDPPGNVLATGGLAGDGTLDDLRTHGAVTGRLAAQRAAAVAHRLQALTARARPVEGDEPAWAPDERTPLGRDSHPELYRSDTHGMVDLSEDVGSKDLVAAAREGYDSVELAKRFTTATMGPSQGKLETVNTVAAIAEARGETIAQVGTTVWRPPYAPLTLGRAGRAGVRAGAGVVDPSVARGQRGDHDPRRPVDPPRPLRRSRRRSPQRAHQCRADRRHAVGQARPARSRHPEAAQPALHQQVVETAVRQGALRDDVRRGRRGARRRRHRPPGRRSLPDDHHQLRCGRSVGVGRELAADRATPTGRFTSPR